MSLLMFEFILAWFSGACSGLAVTLWWYGRLIQRNELYLRAVVRERMLALEESVEKRDEKAFSE